MIISDFSIFSNPWFLSTIGLGVYCLIRERRYLELLEKLRLQYQDDLKKLEEAYRQRLDVLQSAENVVWVKMDATEKPPRDTNLN